MLNEIKEEREKRKSKMKKVDFMLEVETIAKLDRLSKEIGVTKSEIIRLAVKTAVTQLEKEVSRNENATKYNRRT